MARSAAVALANTTMQTRSQPASVFRDFSQPWLDLNDKSVMVTGGTGSFGKHFLKTVVERYRPRHLIIFSRDELKQSEMAQSFPVERSTAVTWAERFLDTLASCR